MNERQFPDLQERFLEAVLPNGLRVCVIPKPDFAKVYSILAVHYGSVDTAFTLDGTAFRTPDGVAHYLEHKMFDMPEGNVMQQFSAMGGSPNAFTGYAMTAYYVESTERWEDNLRLLLQYVSTPYFTDESVEKERGIISQEIRMYEDSADSRIYENLFRAMYDHHPVRVPIAGTVESIQSITAETLHLCYRAFYTPQNMILCVAGPVDAETVAAIASAETPAAGGATAVRDYGPEEALTGHRRRVEERMEVAMPTFTAAFKCTAEPGGCDTLRREVVGDLAAELLAGESTPLYTRLYESGLIDSSFSAGYESVKGLGMISVSGDSCDPDAVVQAILEEAARIAREGADPALFSRLLRSGYGRRIRELDSFENICYRMCQSRFRGEEYCDFPALYRSVTQDEAEALLRDAVVPERSAVSLIFPKKG